MLGAMGLELGTVWKSEARKQCRTTLLTSASHSPGLRCWDHTSPSLHQRNWGDAKVCWEIPVHREQVHRTLDAMGSCSEDELYHVCPSMISDAKATTSKCQEQTERYFDEQEGESVDLTPSVKGSVRADASFLPHRIPVGREKEELAPWVDRQMNRAAECRVPDDPWFGV